MRNTVFFAGQPEHAVRFGSKKTIHVDEQSHVGRIKSQVAKSLPACATFCKSQSDIFRHSGRCHLVGPPRAGEKKSLNISVDCLHTQLSVLSIAQNQKVLNYSQFEKIISKKTFKLRRKTREEAKHLMLTASMLSA